MEVKRFTDEQVFGKVKKVIAKMVSKMLKGGNWKKRWLAEGH